MKIVLSILCVIVVANGLKAERRAIYNLKRNPFLYEFDSALKKGANGFYMRVTFESSGLPYGVGSSLNPNRFETYISFLTGKAKSGASTGLLMHAFALDLGGVSDTGRKYAASKVVEALIPIIAESDRHFFVVLFIESVFEISTFENLHLNETARNILDGQIANAINNGNSSENLVALRRCNIKSSQIWQGFANSNENYQPRLIKSTELRDRGEISKVISNGEKGLNPLNMDDKRTELELKVDGIISNHPEHVVAVLKEPHFVKDFRLATAKDKPLLQ